MGLFCSGVINGWVKLSASAKSFNVMVGYVLSHSSLYPNTVVTQEKRSLSSLLLFLYEKFRDSSLGSEVFRPEGSGQVVPFQPFTSLILSLKPAPDKQMGLITAHAVFLSFLGLQLPKTPNNSLTHPGKVLISVICCDRLSVAGFLSLAAILCQSGCFDAFRTPFQSRADKSVIRSVSDMASFLSPAAADVEHCTL